jgi:hypothetical protein
MTQYFIMVARYDILLLLFSWPLASPNHSTDLHHSLRST